MATIKLTLDTRRAKKNGTYNLVFRITSYKKFKDITTGHSVNRDEFDVTTATVLNNPTFNQQLQELNKHYVNSYFRNKAISAWSIS